MDVVSIITPVYNTEKYLSQCIDSVIDQSYTDWELWLVDDGSTDSSGSICDEYGKRDKRIFVIHKDNEGPSAARNRGLDEANGNYIMFLDADDELRSYCLSFCMQKMQSENVDIVCAECQSIFPNGREYDSKRPVFEESILDCDSYLTKILCYDTLCSIWAKLYKRDVIGSCRFNEKVKKGEDVLFLTDIMLTSKCDVLLTPKVVCNYRILNESISHNTRQNISNNKILIQNFLVYKEKLPGGQLCKYFDYAIFHNIREIIHCQGIIKHIDDDLFSLLRNILSNPSCDFPIEAYWRKTAKATDSQSASNILARSLFVQSFMDKFKNMIKSIVR